jgi:hypothetical protein
VLNSLAGSAVAGYLASHAGQTHAAADAATHSYDVVFTISAVVLLVGSLFAGALAHGGLPRLAITPPASGPHAVRARGPSANRTAVMTSLASDPDGPWSGFNFPVYSSSL